MIKQMVYVHLSCWLYEMMLPQPGEGTALGAVLVEDTGAVLVDGNITWAEAAGASDVPAATLVKVDAALGFTTSLK